MKNKNELIEKMYSIIYGTRDKSIEIKVNTYLRDHGQFENSFLTLSNKNNMEQISDKNALILANALENFVSIGLEDYFTPSEIASLNNYEVDEISDEQLMTFHNVFKLDNRQYCAVASVEQIAMLQNRGLVIVDPNFQRQTKREKINNNILETVYVNSARVNEIAQSLEKNEEDGAYKFNAIRYNLMLDDGNFPEIENDGTIHLDPKHKLICIDGNHRQKAAVKAYTDSNNKEQFKNKYFVVLLTNFTVREVKDTISQEWNVEKVSRSAKANMKNSSENEIANSVRFSDKLEPLVANSFNNIAAVRNKFIATEFFAAIIKTVYGDVKLKSKQQVVVDKIIDVLNRYALLNEESFEKQEFNNPAQGWRFSNISMMILVWLSNKLDLSDPNWTNRFDDVINNIDWANKPSKPVSPVPNVLAKQVVQYCEDSINV